MTAPLRVLVVEDDAQLLCYLAALLAGWGYEIEMARSATEAMASCERKCPDVVISDMVMPGMDGLGLLRALREVQQCRPQHFIILTGHGSVASAVRAIMEGADDVMTKPLQESELLARLQQYEAERSFP